MTKLQCCYSVSIWPAGTEIDVFSTGGRNLPRSLLASVGDSEGFAVPTTLPPNSSRQLRMFSPNKEAELAFRQQLDSISVSCVSSRFSICVRFCTCMHSCGSVKRHQSSPKYCSNSKFTSSLKTKEGCVLYFGENENAMVFDIVLFYCMRVRVPWTTFLWLFIF